MTPPPPTPIPPGATVLDDYRIERELAADGFAVTYLARDLHLDRQVTIAEYLPREWGTRGADGALGPRSPDDAGQYEWGLEQFLANARTLAQVDHHQIVKVHRIAEADGTAYVVMEHVKGRSLAVGAEMLMDEAARRQDAKSWCEMLQGVPSRLAARRRRKPRRRPARAPTAGHRRLVYPGTVVELLPGAASTDFVARNPQLGPQTRSRLSNSAGGT